jgi:hypothetical protein
MKHVKHDSVNHPKHYNSHPSGVECIDIIEHMPLCTGNVIKYLWRAGLKDTAPTLEDYKKARWYLEREIRRLEKPAKKTTNNRKKRRKSNAHQRT